MITIGWAITTALILAFNHGCKLASEARVKDGKMQAVRKAN